MTKSSDQIATLYDWRYTYGGTVARYDLVAAADVDLLGKYLDLTTAKICDVGCGNGAHLHAIRHAGAAFPVGIDLGSVPINFLSPPTNP